MYVLTTLNKLRQHIGLASSDTSDDSRLLDALSAATRTIEHTTGRTFQPHLKTMNHTVNASECLLNDDLLTLQRVTTSDGSEISLDNATVVDSYLLQFEPLLSDKQQISITGTWGYHPDWGNAWADSGDTVQNISLNATDMVLNVTDADAGSMSRFQVGQLLRIEEEYLTVIAVDTDTNTLSVLRGVNGSVASAHSTGTPIEIYQVPANIQQITLRWAVWYYREPDAVLTELPTILAHELADIRRITVSS